MSLSLNRLMAKPFEVWKDISNETVIVVNTNIDDLSYDNITFSNKYRELKRLGEYDNRDQAINHCEIQLGLVNAALNEDLKKVYVEINS